ncbi:hypothetical protein BTO00_22660, partial [Vibrio campbellii]|uniref:hypothetical protein n=1 Tax=Vibrio campbellii TaxID=680 RepID=UPI000D483EA8
MNKVTRLLFICFMAFLFIWGRAVAQEVTLTYTQPLATESKVQLSPSDQMRYSSWQIDWHKIDVDGIETPLESNTAELTLSDSDLNAGDKVFARLTSGTLTLDSAPTPPYEVIGGNTYNINVAHDAAHIVIQSSETITVTSASLQVDGFTVNQTPSYLWFGINDESDLGKPYGDITAFTTLTGPTNANSYQVSSSDNTRYYGVEIAYDDAGTPVTKVLYFEAAIVRLPQSQTDYQVFEDIMLNELGLRNDLELWLDVNDQSTLFTDTGCTIPASNGDEVGCWQDKSGNDRHVYDMNYSGTGGLDIPTDDPDVGDAGRPVYNEQSTMFQGNASLDFDGTQFDALVHKLDEEWFSDFTLIQILGYTQPATDWYSTFATRTTRLGGSEWPNEPQMSLQFHYFNGNYQSSWRAMQPGDPLEGNNVSVDFGVWQQDVSQVLELRNSCMATPNMDPMSPDRQNCTQSFYREGEFIESSSMDIRADSTLFSEYGINKNRGGNLTPSVSHSEVLLFSKELTGCEAFVVGRYIGLKLSRAIGRIPLEQSGMGYDNGLEVLGYNEKASNECGQDFFVDTGDSSSLQLSFDPFTPASSDYDLVNKDEFILFGHNGDDFSTLQSEPLPMLPVGSNITSVVARLWQVEFDSPSGADDAIKQLTVVFNTVDMALQLNNANYPTPYLLIQRNSMPLEVLGRYSGNNTITFDQVDLEHNDIMQLGFDINQSNTAPTSDNASIYIESPYSFKSSDFVYNDVNNDDFFRLRIVNVPPQGTLTFKGDTVNNGDEILVSELSDLIYSYDSSIPFPVVLDYQVSDGIGWSGQAQLTMNNQNFFLQITPSMSPIRVGDFLTLTSQLEINRVVEQTANIDMVWWVVDTLQDTESGYNPSIQALSSGDNITLTEAEFGKYLMVQSSYTDGLGSTASEFINLGQVLARDDDTRPSSPWATGLQTNSQYVYDGLVITPSLTPQNGEILPPAVEYCYYDNDTDSELQACGFSNTFTVNAALSSSTIRVEARLSDPSNTTIDTQTLSTVLTPLGSSIDLERPQIRPNGWVIPGVTISLEPTNRFSGQSVNYQWYRYADGQYVPIGTNNNTYTVALSDIDSQIMLQVTVDDAGTDVVLTSDLTQTVTLVRSLRLQHDTPLNTTDVIALSNQEWLDDDIMMLNALNGNLTANYQWETSTDGVVWGMLNMPTNTFTEQTNLTFDTYYRLHFEMSDTSMPPGMGASYSIYSDPSPLVQSNSVDYDIDYLAATTPVIDIGYSIYSELTSPSGPAIYNAREYQWYRIYDGGG